MSIITISRHQAALGDETARALAKALNYQLVDRQLLEEKMKSYSSSLEINIEKYDERKPAFLSGLTQAPDYYLHFLKTALFEESIHGNCILVGRGAGFIFHGLPGLISVHLTAPMDIRIERVKGYFHCDERRAVQIIEQRDTDKRGFIRYYFDADWNDPANYSICLNTGQFSPDACAGIIKNQVEQIMTAEVLELYNKKLQDMYHGHTIEQEILIENKIQINFLQITVDDAYITLFGVSQSHALAAAAATIAEKYKGNREVRSEISIVQQDMN